VTRDQTSRTDAFAMFMTAAACLGLGNIALGVRARWGSPCACGCAVPGGGEEERD